MSNITLFCIPYGGGSSANFEAWKNWWPGIIELNALDLPGHGRRTREPLCEDIDKIVEDFIERYFQNIQQPYFIFGHSLGGLIGHRIVRRLRKMKINPPLGLIVSACRAPHLPYSQSGLHCIADDEFLEKIISFGGVPELMLGSDAALRFLFKTLRADLKIAEVRSSLPESKIEDVALYVFSGINDPIVSMSEADEWSLHFVNPQSFYFKGGHFFINDESSAVQMALSKILLPLSHSGVKS